MAHLYYIVNNMAVDVLVTQGASESAAMLLSEFSWNILAEGLTLCGWTCITI